METINRNNFSVTKNAFLLFKFIFQVLCLCILLYQLIGITTNYLNFAYDVKLNIKEKNDLKVPSVTFCLKRHGLWRVRNFQSKKCFFGQIILKENKRNLNIHLYICFKNNFLSNYLTLNIFNLLIR